VSEHDRVVPALAERELTREIPRPLERQRRPALVVDPARHQQRQVREPRVVRVKQAGHGSRQRGLACGCREVVLPDQDRHAQQMDERICVDGAGRKEVAFREVGPSGRVVELPVAEVLPAQQIAREPARSEIGHGLP
jgi:hypothetical protein